MATISDLIRHHVPNSVEVKGSGEVGNVVCSIVLEEVVRVVLQAGDIKASLVTNELRGSRRGHFRADERAPVTNEHKETKKVKLSCTTFTVDHWAKKVNSGIDFEEEDRSIFKP